jgi:predicted nucleic acid-binding protein
MLALAFKEAGWDDVAARLKSFEILYVCALLEAELRSAHRREGVPVEEAFLAELEVVLATRSLREEFKRVLEAGYVRGADCFHLATALSLTSNPAELTFLTLDKRQRDVAAALGFAT